MAGFKLFFVFWCIIYTVVYCDSRSFTIPSFREPVGNAAIDSLATLRIRQSGSSPSEQGKTLYWFSNFSIGASGPLKLVIDTLSSDCIINPGLYKPSKHAKPYSAKHFSNTYAGVNREGFGFKTVNGSIFEDVVTAAGLSIPNLPIGDIKTFEYFDSKPLPFATPGQGQIGFNGKRLSGFKPPSPSWFFRLCSDGVISDCRFGLAFGTSGKGFTIIGKIAKSLFKNKLTRAIRIRHPYPGWAVRGDVAINNKIVLKNQVFFVEAGASNIQAPIDASKKIFNILGYKYTEETGGPNLVFPKEKYKVIHGFFPCNKPPTLGFSFPAQSDLQKSNSYGASKKAKIFSISPKVWDVYNHGNNNCTSILGGTDVLSDGGLRPWTLGQPFLEGHYVDFHIGGTVGFADLEDPTMAKI